MNLKGYNLNFDAVSHTYELGGKLLTGTTTILGILDKPFLKPWVAKLTSETIERNWKPEVPYTKDAITLICKDAKSAYKNVGKEAMDSGKLAHEFIEKLVKKLIETPLSKDKYQELYESLLAELPKDDKAVNSIGAFMKWMGEHEVRWLASELVLASPTYTFAGTIDAVAMIDGVMTLVDFKTSNQISDDYNLQLAAYYILLDENLADEEPRPTQRLILRIPKTGKDFEAKVVESDLKFEIDTFLHLREAYKWTVYMKNNN